MFQPYESRIQHRQQQLQQPQRYNQDFLALSPGTRNQPHHASTHRGTSTNAARYRSTKMRPHIPEKQINKKNLIKRVKNM
mmetsp:Transcript_38297/g.58380  ORF Transcript_38297/g.58380 Transcript_38297/m.58380 type:complete len:80 (+) Transcript_38297:1507-1746(+)